VLAIIISVGIWYLLMVSGSSVVSVGIVNCVEVQSSHKLFFFFIYIFICAYIVWVISPPAPPPPPSPSYPDLPCFQAEPVLPFSPILLKRIRNNKRDKVFLLVKIRIAIQRDS
jgi:hypothetical protein